MRRIEGDVFPDFTFGTHAVEVAVDEETGKVEVLKLVACYDVGRAINRLSVEGQLEGGAIYAMGYGLTEEVMIEKGVDQNALIFGISHPDIPGCAGGRDDPPRIRRRGGSLRGKGVGEPSVNSVAPAIANAVYDAVGVRIFDLPSRRKRS